MDNMEKMTVKEETSPAMDIDKMVSESGPAGVPIEMAKMSENGQITIPIEIRRKIELQKGDKVLFYEEDGMVYFVNASRRERAFAEAQKIFSKLRKEFGVETEEDVDRMIKEYRMSHKGQ